jgi:seryl-tRNA synthetase
VTPVEPEVRPVAEEQIELLGELVAQGLLIESGVPGVLGHGEVFERIREAVEQRISREARERGAVKLRFPPVLPKAQLEATGYLGNMPHLAGSIFSFTGDEIEAEAQAERAARHEDWSEFQRQTDVTLMPAACYPVYPAIAGRGPLMAGGVFVDAGGSWVFRHEPSLDPARRQIFHQHELVRIGEPDVVVEWRQEWADRGLRLLSAWGLEGRLDGANDPFFGRRGRMLARNQRADELKIELLVEIAGPEPTACASFNHHLDHFGRTFGLTTSDGATAHTACLGFGHERIVLALLHTHGFDPARWPAAVRADLWEPTP